MAARGWTERIKAARPCLNPEKAQSNEEWLVRSLNADDEARNGEPDGNSAATDAVAGGRSGCK